MSRLLALVGAAWVAACSPIVVVESGSGGAGYGGSSSGGADAGAEAGGGQGGQAKPPNCVTCSDVGSLSSWELDKACPGSVELANAIVQCGCSHCPTCPEVCIYHMSFEDSKCYNCFLDLDLIEVCPNETEACMEDI